MGSATETSSVPWSQCLANDDTFKNTAWGTEVGCCVWYFTHSEKHWRSSSRGKWKSFCSSFPLFWSLFLFEFYNIFYIFSMLGSLKAGSRPSWEQPCGLVTSLSQPFLWNHFWICLVSVMIWGPPLGTLHLLMGFNTSSPEAHNGFLDLLMQLPMMPGW